MKNTHLNFNYYFFLFGALILLSGRNTVFAQDSYSIRFTPNSIIGPKIEILSPEKIYGRRRLSFDADFQFSHLLNKTWGFNVGLGAGLVGWNFAIDNPGVFFTPAEYLPGTATSGNSSDIYASLSFNAEHYLHFKNFRLKSYLGPGIRYYVNTGELFYMAAFRNTQNDPNPEAPDIAISLKGNDKFELGINAGLGIEKTLSPHSAISVGIRNYLAFHPIEEGRIRTKMNGQEFRGEFSPRSSYTGLDLVYKYSLVRKPVPAGRSLYNNKEGVDSIFRRRKTVFVEALGNGVALSVNYDIRLKPGRNDGFGLRVGLGVGEYAGTVNGTEVNKTVPLSINYLIGNRMPSLELGLGLTPKFALSKLEPNEPHVEIIPFANIGFRLQPLTKGIILRTTFTPSFDNGSPKLWGGLSLGYSFR
jgi:hypothetical protein